MANVHEKTHLFGNPHTLKLKQVTNGFGGAGENSLETIFDLLSASYNRGGDSFLARADNDFYPRDGGSADGSMNARFEFYNIAAVNTFTKGDALEDVSWQYEGRGSAKAKVLTVLVPFASVQEDITVDARHGGTPGTASLSIEAVLEPSQGPYEPVYAIAVENDNTRDASWTPITVN
jgi:hypothetical protein